MIHNPDDETDKGAAQSNDPPDKGIRSLFLERLNLSRQFFLVILQLLDPLS
jgi:hypothetical protein